MGITEYAAHRGCGEQTVREAIIAGRITRNADGSIDPVKADQDWEQHTQSHMQGTGKQHFTQMRPDRFIHGHGATEPKPGMSYVDARALKETYDAMRKKLELDVLAGNLVERAGLEEHAHNRYRQLRDACLQMPGRLAARLAAETDEHAVYTMLEAEVKRIFTRFAEGRLT